MRSQDWKQAAPNTRKRGPATTVRCSQGHPVALVRGDIDVRTATFTEQACTACGEAVRVPRSNA